MTLPEFNVMSTITTVDGLVSVMKFNRHGIRVYIDLWL